MRQIQITKPSFPDCKCPIHVVWVPEGSIGCRRFDFINSAFLLVFNAHQNQIVRPGHLKTSKFELRRQCLGNSISKIKLPRLFHSVNGPILETIDTYPLFVPKFLRIYPLFVPKSPKITPFLCKKSLVKAMKRMQLLNLPYYKGVANRSIFGMLE